jgi:putative addiction module killer protein
LIRVLEYLDLGGRSTYAVWLESLTHEAAAKVVDAVFRLSQGNFSNVRSVGAGVSERKIDFGPGYRIYFGRDGGTLVILLGGSSKQDQWDAIATARTRWQDYRRRKR